MVLSNRTDFTLFQQDRIADRNIHKYWVFLELVEGNIIINDLI